MKLERASPSDIGRCALCRQERELRLSHIIPEFFYRRIYDEKHRFFEYSTDPIDAVSPPHQKGLREKLLCEECEGRLAVWEKHVREVFFGGVALEWSADAEGAIARGIDYAKFKLFSMSLLWRAAVSTLSHYAEVDLGISGHEGALRQRLIAAKPGAFYEYGCFMLFVPDPDARRIFGHVIGPVDCIRIKGHWVYRFLLGGTFWFFPVSARMAQLPKDGFLFSILESNTLKVYNGRAPIVGYLVRLADELRKANEAR